MILSTPDSSIPDLRIAKGNKRCIQKGYDNICINVDEGKMSGFFFGRDLLNNTLPQSVPHLILVDGRVPLLCAQVGRDKVVHFLSQVLIGRLPTTVSDSNVNMPQIQMHAWCIIQFSRRHHATAYIPEDAAMC